MKSGVTPTNETTVQTGNNNIEKHLLQSGSQECEEINISTKGHVKNVDEEAKSIENSPNSTQLPSNTQKFFYFYQGF